MTFEVIALLAAMAVAGAVCMAVLFVRDARQERGPAPVRLGAGLYSSRSGREALRPRNR